VLQRLSHLVRSQAILVLVLGLGVGAAGAIVFFEQNADASRQAVARLESIRFAAADLQGAPYNADPRSGGSPAYARGLITSDARFISDNLRTLITAGSPPGSLLRIPRLVRSAGPAIQQIFEIGAYRGGYGGPERVQVSRQQRILSGEMTPVMSLLTQAQRFYTHRAATAKTEAIFGSVAAILTLLGVFVLFYRRATRAQAHAAAAQTDAERLSAENLRLLEASRDEAITDPLTGLGNRRAFKQDLDEILQSVTIGDELMLAMFDLDGFKLYNDTFGHGAGDALLIRLAGCLRETVVNSATAYRLGGDEFCLLARATVLDGERLVRSATAALSDEGENWQIGCSWGLAWMPSEATGASDALNLADERMYAQKAGRATAGHQATAALVQVLIERDVVLSAHISHVAELASATALRLGLPDHEITRIGLAAQLHDIGKTAIPESILSKPGPLDQDEWAFMRRHTLIGERIVAAAPSLAHTASLVRSSHERLDGGGYPDGLAGQDIPLGSRIIAVCDAYDAMIATRPYRDPKSLPDALAELRLCAGSQFDPDVVAAFATVASQTIAPDTDSSEHQTSAGVLAASSPPTV
jgi:diguanylate cyclase (GGDEF)-like protein